LHETGQPLHAFDCDKIKGNKIIVKNLPTGTSFITLDEKERKLNEEDLMICNGNEEPMCFGGVYGGINSGVTTATTRIFLESAWFDPVSIRKTSFRHNLRTDAAIRFEKGTDISNTVNVLKRAALMIREIAGGEISSELMDVYPVPKTKTNVTLYFDYLKKISGKNYSSQTVNKILESLGFEIKNLDEKEITVAVPFSKPDISLPADIVEEIMRIDGFDNVDIPQGIFISPAIDPAIIERSFVEKVASYLVGNGFSEIFTNSITNSAYYDNATLNRSVKILNSLSTELDIMRPGLLYSGLECIAYNLNRKNNNLLLFEFGKSYSAGTEYNQVEHLCLYLSGSKNERGWRTKENRPDIYFLKGICDKIFSLCGLVPEFLNTENSTGTDEISIRAGGKIVGTLFEVSKQQLDKFSIKQPVIFADLFWDKLVGKAKLNKIEYKEIPKFPVVHRDLSIIVEKNIVYSNVEEAIIEADVKRLTEIKLFDVFESEKLGKDKKSFAISLTFSDSNKTLTDIETDQMMNEVIRSLEKMLKAQIRTAN
jgi:phenylalanyl-tRNA synthetase beta chain